MIDLIWFDLPKLTTFTIGSYSFYKTNSLTLSSIMIMIDNWFDLTKLNAINIDDNSFSETRSVTMESS